MIRLVLGALACLAVLADAFYTRRGLKAWRTEANPVRAWLIDKLGLNAGVFGVAGLVSGGVILMNALNPVSPTLIFSNLAIILFYSYAANANRE